MTEVIAFSTRDEWLKARAQKIGGSDASCIVGMNPYKTNQDLYLEKTGVVTPEDIGGKDFVRYGVQAEPILRQLFGIDHPEIQITYTENNMFMNPDYPWAHASLDGWLTDKDGRLGVLEIKTTNILQSMAKEKWHDRIPDNYYIQILHYMMVTGAEFAVLKALLRFDYDGIYEQIREYWIERSEVEQDIEELIRAERKFWEAMQAGRTPDLVLPQI